MWRKNNVIVLSKKGENIGMCSPNATTVLLRKKIVKVYCVNPFTIQLIKSNKNSISKAEEEAKIIELKKIESAKIQKERQKEFVIKKREIEKLLGKKEAKHKKKLINYFGYASTYGYSRRDSNKIYMKRNKEKIKAMQQRRRASGTLSGVEIKEIGEGQQWRCFYCMLEIKESYSLDHYHPIKLGGLTNKDNIVLCCRTCNSIKNMKTPKEFYEYILKYGIKGYIYENSHFFKRIRAEMESVEK